jgi:uncharacterized protein YxjI
LHPAFQHTRYVLKRQVIALTGTLRIYDPAGNLQIYSRQKMLRLREDIRAYSDESRSQELLYIQARQIIDFSAAYDIYDSTNGELVGTLRRRGLSSIARDEWQILAPNQALIGVLQEDSLALALMRRMLLGSLLPQNYDLLIGGQRLADLRQRFNILRYTLDIDFSMDEANHLDRRLGLAAGILLGTIEGRQD